MHTFTYEGKDYQVVVADPTITGGMTKKDRETFEEVCAIKRDDMIEKLQGRVV